MKKAIRLLCVFTALLCLVTSAMAADSGARSTQLYPVSVEEYTEGDFDELRIQKVYQLSLDDDPSLIPTEDFERNGRLYYLLDMTRKDEVGVDTKPHVQTVTMPSDTNNMEKILQTLDAEIETVTEDGYTGKLHLDHTTVKVTTDGYATKTGTLLFWTIITSGSRTTPWSPALCTTTSASSRCPGSGTASIFWSVWTAPEGKNGRCSANDTAFLRRNLSAAMCAAWPST